MKKIPQDINRNIFEYLDLLSLYKIKKISKEFDNEVESFINSIKKKNAQKIIGDNFKIRFDDFYEFQKTIFGLIGNDYLLKKNIIQDCLIKYFGDKYFIISVSHENMENCLLRINILLIVGTNPNLQDKYGRTPLNYSCEKGNEKMVNILLSCAANASNLNIPYTAYTAYYGNTPLHVACINKYEKIVKMLLSAGVNPNIQNFRGETPLHMAPTENMIEILIDSGANINHQDKQGNTPLNSLCWLYGTNDRMKLLIKKGAILDIENAFGETPLFKVFQHCDEEKFRLLMNAGSNINYKNKFGKTLLTIFENENNAKMLFQKYTKEKNNNWTPLSFYTFFSK